MAKTGTNIKNYDNSPDMGNVDYVVEWQKPTERNGYTWYRLYASGWIEMGGYPTTSSSITFPKTMTNDKYWFICHYIGNSTNASNFANYGHTPTINGFSYNNASTSGTTTFVWEARGYAA